MMTAAIDLIERDFGTLAELVAAHGRERPAQTAIVDACGTIDYASLDLRVDRIAAALQRDGVTRGQCIAILGFSCIDYVAVMLGALRVGAVPTPLAPSSTRGQIAAMLADCAAPLLFVDDAAEQALASIAITTRTICFGDPFEGWLEPPGARPTPATIHPDDPFTIIYSSGTTGTPKGIVQSHRMRWWYVRANRASSYADAVTMIATPLYSNTTNVTFLPTLAFGGTLVLMAKFDARRFLELSEAHRATHVMLVPVQYARIMADPAFDRFDLSSYRLKCCTSAPFSAALKADVVARWPGLLVEFYGMTEGGGSTRLIANAHRDKLHTVGQPMDGHDIRIIDDEGRELPAGATGEVVSRSPAMMTGYHRREGATNDALWHDSAGTAFIRHGDIGRFDADGFLTLLDRKKDVIISGGFNLYPSDLEAVLAAHPDVADCTVIGVPSEAWGETPVGYFVPRTGTADAGAILAWFNAQVGKTQRLSALEPIDELPRSAIGKVLKRELRDRWLKEIA